LLLSKLTVDEYVDVLIIEAVSVSFSALLGFTFADAGESNVAGFSFEYTGTDQFMGF
jgi:hypothetical protein